MKRMIVTVTGTVAGLAALLSFKTQTHPLADAAALPSATASSPGSTSSPSGSGSSSAGASASPPSSGAPTRTVAAPKTYTGRSVTTRYGVVQVKVTVAAGKVTDVAFVQLTAFDQRSQQINSYAGPALLQETIKKQSAQVDTVSGASYTSEGYRESLQSALDQAGIA